jgi:hypothetical protein
MMAKKVTAHELAIIRATDPKTGKVTAKAVPMLVDRSKMTRAQLSMLAEIEAHGVASVTKHQRKSLESWPWTKGPATTGAKIRRALWG